MDNSKTCYKHSLNFKNPFCRPWIYRNSAASFPVDNNAPFKAVVAGACAGGLESLILYPLEYVKTQLQLEEKAGAFKKYSGIIDCATKTVQSRGMTGLYRGMDIVLFAAIPKAAVRFGSYEGLKSQALDENGNISLASSVLCGFGAGLFEAVLVVVPMETIKVKLIDDQRREHPMYKGFFHAVKMIVEEKGLPGIYKGLMTTVVKQCSSQGVRFFIMESLKSNYNNGDSTVPVPKVLVAVVGAVSGFVSVIVNAPVDVVKTRMQSLIAYKYDGNIDCMRKIWTEEGPKAFFKGMDARLIHVTVGVSINFVIYYCVMDVMNKYLF